MGYNILLSGGKIRCFKQESNKECKMLLIESDGRLRNGHEIGKTGPGAVA